MRGSPTYLWRKVLLEFWNWWLGLAMAIFAIWALFALPLFKIYPVCVNPEDLSERIELRGEVTPEFNSWFVHFWRHSGMRGERPISADRRVPAFYYYSIDKQSLSYTTGHALVEIVQYRFPDVDIDIGFHQPQFPHLWVIWYAPNCDGLRKIALQGGAWANRGPELWPDGDPDPDAPPIRRR